MLLSPVNRLLELLACLIKKCNWMSDDHIIKRKKYGMNRKKFRAFSLFLTYEYCIFFCASPIRKSRLWTLWDPLRIRVPQDEVEADYMQHSQVSRILHPLPVMVARLPSALHLRFILFKEGFKGFPFLCPPACDRVRSLAAIDPNMHCGGNNTCLVLTLSYRNIRDCARTCIFAQNSTHLLSNLNRELISHYYHHWFSSGYQETRTTKRFQAW